MEKTHIKEREAVKYVHIIVYISLGYSPYKGRD